MARKSLSAQLAELREYTAKLEIEVAGLREIAARKSSSNSSFKARAQSRAEKAREYCQLHGVSSVSRKTLDAWMGA